MGGQKIYPYKCKVCGKEFCIDKATMNKLISGKYKDTYCCKECSVIAKQTGREYVCDNCGKVFYRKPSHAQRHEKQFCCSECSSEYVHNLNTETRQCGICGKEFEVTRASTQRFCSRQCQGKWQSTQINELNPRSRKKKISCDYCGKDFLVKNYKIGTFNNLFCSNACRRRWFAEIFTQDEKYKEQSRIRGAYIMSMRATIDDCDKINSKPQLIANSLLDALSIEYEREKQFTYYSADNYLPYFNLIIEIQGDYWHCNPIKYTDKISGIQADNIRSDKAKHTYLKNKYGIDVLYLWESDLYKKSDLCKALIKLYVDNNGILPNYNSFNYQLIDDKAVLSEDLIVPYQEQPYEFYGEKIYQKNTC